MNADGLRYGSQPPPFVPPALPALHPGSPSGFLSGTPATMSGRTARFKIEPARWFVSVMNGWYGLPPTSRKTPEMLQPPRGPLTYHGAFLKNWRPLPNGRSYVEVAVNVCVTSKADNAR